jgi:hypothetical protein
VISRIERLWQLVEHSFPFPLFQHNTLSKHRITLTASSVSIHEKHDGPCVSVLVGKEKRRTSVYPAATSLSKSKAHIT